MPIACWGWGWDWCQDFAVVRSGARIFCERSKKVEALQPAKRTHAYPTLPRHADSYPPSKHALQSCLASIEREREEGREEWEEEVLTTRLPRMHLMYTLDAQGKRVYTLKKVVDGRITNSAHPARFSPDDTYSRYVPTRRTHTK